MHPILTELLTKPVGWLSIAGMLITFGLPLGLHLFLRRKIRESEAEARRNGELPRD